MDCRTARPYLIDEQDPTLEQQQAYRAHLAGCAACRDDQDDLFSRALVQTTRELALPPPDFTAKLMQRLPPQAPMQIAAQAIRRRRLMGWGVVAVGVVAVIAGFSTQGFWAGTTLGLVAQAILTATAAALAPLVVMVASAIAVALLLELIAQNSTAGKALGATLVAGLLLLSTGAVTTINDGINAAVGSRSGSTIATILGPVRVTTALDGDAVSLAGDISVDAPVSGNVASLGGSISLAPPATIGGDLLAGAGTLQGDEAQVVGDVLANTGPLAAAAASLEQGPVSLAPSVVRGLTLLLGALVTLVLTGLVVLIWPQRTLQTSRLLPAEPLTALGLGILVTSLLVLLALPILALLAATVAGLLLVPVLIMAVHLAYVQGLAAVGQALGQQLVGTPTTMSAVWGVAAQLLLVFGLGLYAPVAGLIAFYLLASLGLGAQMLAYKRLV